MSSDNSQRQLLAGLARALQSLLHGGEFNSNVQRALGELGQAADTERVYIFENLRDASGSIHAIRQRFEWVAEGTVPEIDNPDLQFIPYDPKLARWRTHFLRHEPVYGIVSDFPDGERDILEPQNILALAVVPIVFEDPFWGFLGFDNCRTARHWTTEEIELLQAAAAGFGGAFERQVASDRLREANDTLALQAAELQRSRRVALSLTEDAQLAGENAAAANRAKSEFLAVMSHEMRTPLHGILGFVDLLLDEPLPPVALDHVRTVGSSGQILLTLINDLLNFSKIESGSLEIDPSVVDLREVLLPDTQTLRRLADQRRISLKVSFDPSVPTYLELDANRFRQIARNIIGNAIKFTEKGGVSVTITTSPFEKTDSLLLETTVEDTGIGIGDDNLTRIFEPFIQASVTTHRRHGGTGLGLSICRNLCTKMGGSIDVQSELGRGSIFQFSVLARPVNPATLERRGTNLDRIIPNLEIDRSTTFLVVDDVATNRRLMSAILKRMGLEATLAESGEDALQKCASRAFTVILMDVCMPGIDGYETTTRIRELETSTGHRSAIFGLSADVLPENHQLCLRHGMNGFLSKPLHLPTFVDLLNSTLGRPVTDKSST